VSGTFDLFSAEGNPAARAGVHAFPVDRARHRAALKVGHEEALELKTHKLRDVYVESHLNCPAPLVGSYKMHGAETTRVRLELGG
jgi:hypothetical protein